MAALRVVGALVLALGLLEGRAGAQEPQAQTTPSASSPRAAVESFLELSRRGRYREAALLLDVPAAQAARSEQLASRLDQVLGARASLDLDALSDQPEGASDDGLTPTVDEVGQIQNADGATTGVRLTRSDDTGEWRFSRTTVKNIDGWYAQLERHWLIEHLPAVLLRTGPYGLAWWQWAALPALAVLAWMLGSLLSRVCSWLLIRISHRTSFQWDDVIVARMRGPLTLWWTLGLFRIGASFLELRWSAQQVVGRGLSAGFLLGLFWVLTRSTEVAANGVAHSRWAQGHNAAVSLIPLATRVTKVFIVTVGMVTLLSQLGYPVASLLAGLGIGGLAVALAAQKTVENLLGAFSIGADQPFREGDFVKIEDFVGTVEQIGLRSTRVRTLDRTLITLPNGRVADMRLESFAARDRLRLACTVGLVYSTTNEQMRTVLAGLREALRTHEKIWPDTIVVRFKELAASSLDIEVMAWFQTRDWGEFQAIREEMLLAFMKIVEDAGTSFAFPSRSIYMERPPAASPDEEVHATTPDEARS